MPPTAYPDVEPLANGDDHTRCSRTPFDSHDRDRRAARRQRPCSPDEQQRGPVDDRLARRPAAEFGFGHYVAGDSWSELLENYNLATGHVWPALLLWLLVGPALVHGRRNLRRAG
jgi:hypothetical protein